MRRSEFLKLALAALPAAGRAAEEEFRIVLDAARLYGGFQASRVLLTGGRLTLDTRNRRPGARGVIVSDVIDLGGESLLSTDVSVADLRVQLNAGPDVALLVRTGTGYFQSPGTWTAWLPARGAVAPKGRYAQVRLEWTSPAPVESVTLACRVRRGASAPGPAVSGNVQRIVRSPIEFGYERQDQPDLVWLRETFRLDRVIAGKRTQFDRLAALMHWVARRPNIRPGPWQQAGEPYPWHVRRVLTTEGAIYGHCMSYCEVMLAAAAAFGWHGRHWAIDGVRDTSHEVPEIWIDELGKWVFFDPSLDTYYADAATGEPLSLIEMHELYLKTVLRPGEVQRRGRHMNEDRLRSLRGKHPVRCVTGNYAYGKPARWDWEWDHGYMTAGWMQLTPRNNWHSQPEPAFPHFGNGAEGFGGFPLFIDSQTPLTAEAVNWCTRKRDLWWTLNQASFRLTRTGADSLEVECGNSQPFFRRYLARIGEEAWKPVEPRFAWRLRRGENRLEVAPEDEFGSRGISSSAVVSL